MVHPRKSRGLNQHPDVLHGLFLHHKRRLHTAVIDHEIREIISDAKILRLIGFQFPVKAVDLKRVGKGQKAALKCDIWKYSNRVETVPAKTQDGQETETEIDTSHYYKKLSHFFTAEQVEPVQA